MPVKSIMKRIAMLLCLMSASLHLQALGAAEKAESKSTTEKVDGVCAAGANENSSVNDLTLQTVLPCALTLAEQNTALKNQARETGQPLTFKISTVNAVMAPVPPPETDDYYATKSTTSDDQHAAAKDDQHAAAKPATGSPAVGAEGPSESCGCFDCCKCGAPGDFWIREEYVGWWAQGGRVPALVNTSATGTLPATVTLYGDATYNDKYRSGEWTQGGMWFDCCHEHGIQGDFFFVGRESSPFFASSDGDPILTRPFIDATTGLPAEQLIAVPGVVVGSISVDNHNSLAGAGVSLRRNLCCCCNDCCKSDCGCKSNCEPCWSEHDCSRVDAVYGFRYYGFDDNLGIQENLTSIDPLSPIAIGTQFDVRDTFVTQNNFYGFELGVIRQHYSGRWMTEGTAKVAFGDMASQVRISGSTAISFPGQPTAVNQGGLLALSSNIGNYNHDAFVAVPQISLRVGYRATEQLTFMAGYTFMYFSQIARAGDQIDTVVNPNLIPPPIGGGPNRPAFNFRPSDLVLQGITLGAEYSF
jgi:hypothetical protein